ncbi:MAG: efflux RND transporter periplasmic adaptor subunit [Verrucomicrobia bacterium]|nr:MAG: efflux RND transporter periplasmic adaptor subunit [Verrucomicrobiota bacterium]
MTMRWFKLFPALVAGASALTLASCSKSADAAKTPRDNVIPVQVAKVESVPLDHAVSVIGTLFAKDQATVGAQVEGQCEKTLVDFGDRLTAGQEIALIDTTTYQALAQQSAANVAKAKANAVNAEKNLQRTKDLAKEKIASASDLDTAEAQAKQADADVKSAEAADAVAQLNLEHSRVKAPFDGAVAQRIVSKGDYVKAGSPLFDVVNDSVLKFIFQVPERYASLVQKKLRVNFTVDNYPGETFSGGVYLISPAVSTSSRSFNVGALVTNTDFRLKANTFARGELTLESQVPTVVVPVSSVVSFAGVTKVFVIEGNTARSRQVTLGRIRGDVQEVSEGVKPGEQVAITGQSKLTDGAAVTVQSSAVVQSAAKVSD